MLFQARLDPQGGFDIEQLTMELDEALDVEAFAGAWQHVTARHPMLRARFVEGKDHEPAQIVDDSFRLPVTRASWGDEPDDARAARIAAFLRADRRAGFVLDDGPPPLRLFVASCGPARAWCCWTFHHILLDGRSFAVVLADVFAAYDALRRGQAPALVLPPPPRPFSDFVSWSRALPTADSLPFWRGLLAGKDAPTPVPALRAATSTTGQAGYGERARTVASETTTALRALAKRSGSTLGTVVQAAWALCLNRLTGDDDVVFGTTRACRKSALDGEGSADMVGLFINTLPVRARITDDELLTDLLQRLRQQSLDVRAHEHTPLVDVLGTSSVPRGTPLFQTLLMFENQELNASLRALSPSFARRHFHYEEQPTFPLNVTVFDHGKVGGEDLLELRVLFDRGRFHDVGIDNLMRWLEALLRSMTQAHTTGDVRLLDDDEAAAVLFGPHNQTTRSFPDGTLIHELFEARASDPAFKDAIAVVCANERSGNGDDVVLTFGALEKRANQLAHALIAAGAARGGYVGILLERRVELVVALLAVSKTGAAYVPLDPDYPRDRLSFMLEDSATPVVVTQEKYRALLPESAVLLDIEGDAAAIAARPTTRPARTGQPSDVCYTIYTSGSTGKPKGVVLTHEAVLNTLDWVNREFAFTRNDRLLFVTSVCFDLSVFDVFGALGAGAQIRVATSAELRDPEALVQRLTSGEITVWDSAPAALHRLVPFLPSAPPPAGERGDELRRRRSKLRLVMLSGDWIPVSLPGDMRRAFHDGLQVRCLGGATEAAIWSNFFVVDDVPKHWRSIPYGRPIQNSHYHVLDRRLQPVPPGIAGDLYIGGTCLASGYLKRPELSAERFINDPFADLAARRGVARPGHGKLYKTGDLARYFDDATGAGSLGGELEFLGRADFQVKIRGFRVELGEVDAVIAEHDGVKDALSVARQDASLQKVLVTYVVPKPGAPADDATLVAAIKTHAGGRLPDFMVPTHVVILRQGLPVSVNGKVDRAALSDPLTATTAKTRRAPSTVTEEKLLPIWQAVLGTDALSVDDNFFDRGGHSLLATMLMSRIKTQLGVQVPLSRLFQANTIEKLARSIDADAQLQTTTTAAPGSTPSSSSSSSSLIVLNENGSQTPVFFIAGIGGHVFTFQKLASLLGNDVPTYGFRAIGGESGESPKERVEEIAEAYLAELDERGLTDKPIVLCGYSFGGYVAYELALRLDARGVPPELLVFFDVLAPGYPKRLPVYERALLHLDEFRKKDVSGKVAYVSQRAKNVRGRVLMKLGMAQKLAGDADVGAGKFDADRQQEMRVLWGALAMAQLSYRPSRTTHIPGLLFKAAIPFDWPATKFDDPTHGWRHWLKGTLTVERAEGAHLQLFEGKNPQTMARAILSARR